MPAMRPRSFLTGQKTPLLVPGPPSVPRSIVDPFRQSVACAVVSPAKLENPATQLRLLMLLAPLTVPPSAPSLTTV